MRLGRQLLPMTATKTQLEKALADYRVRLYPSLYAGHEDDAIKFVRNCEGRTRSALLLAAQCYGLAERDY